MSFATFTGPQKPSRKIELTPPARSEQQRGLGEQIARKGVIAGQAIPRGAAGLLGLVDLVAGTELEPRAQGALDTALGPPIQPETPGERLAKSVGTGVGSALPTLPLAALGAPSAGAFATRAGMEMLSGATGQVAADAAEGLGLGTGGQIVAGMAGGMAPGALARIGGGVLSAAAQASLRPVRNRTATKLAAQILGREVRDRRSAIVALDQEIKAPLFGRATTDQALEAIAPGLYGSAESRARSGIAGPDLRREATQIRIANARAALETGERDFRSGQVGPAMDAYLAKLEKIENKVRKAYQGVGNLEGVPTSRIKAAAAYVWQEAGDELAGSVPKQTKLIADYGETVDLQTLKRLRTSIAQQVRGAVKDPERAQEVFFLNKLADAVESTFEEVAGMGGSREVNALRRARTIRAVQAKRFDPKDPLNKIFGDGMEFGKMQSSFDSYLRTATKPAEGLRRLRATLGGDAEAWAGVQSLMRDKIFGEDFGLLFSEGGGLLKEGGARTALKNLRKHREAFDAVYGDGSAKNAERFLERARQLGTGVVGKKDQFAKTMSGVQDADQALQQAGLIAEMATSGWKNFAWKLTKLVSGNIPKTLADAELLFTEALIDPQKAKGLLEQLPPEAVPIWRSRFTSTTTKGVRSTAAAQNQNTGQ